MPSERPTCHGSAAHSLWLSPMRVVTRCSVRGRPCRFGPAPSCRRARTRSSGSITPSSVKAATSHFGVLICFDDSDADLARQYVRTDSDGAPVDFLLNISNDGWFDGTSEHDEHLAVCRFRAVECRRSLARAVNMGISAVIDAN